MTHLNGYAFDELSERAKAEVCSRCGGPGPIQVGLCEGCDYVRESDEANRLRAR